MNEQILDRELRDVFGQGPQAAPSGTVDRALLVARGVQQRRPRFARVDPRAWPPQRRSFADPGARRSARLAFVAIVAVLGAAAAIAIGARLLDQRYDVPSELAPAGLVDEFIRGPNAFGLSDGRIVIHGGGHAATFDPATGASTRLNLSPFSLDPPRMALLPDGRVLLIGRLDERPADLGPLDVEPLFAGYLDVNTGIVTVGPRLDGLPSLATLVIANGKALFFGGIDGDRSGAVATVYAFDPSSGELTKLQSMSRPGVRLGTVVLDDGRVLLVHEQPGDAEIYDPDTGTSTIVGSVTGVTHPLIAAPVRLADGRVLIARPGHLTSACGTSRFEGMAMYLYDPVTNEVTGAPDLSVYITGMVPTADGRVVALAAYPLNQGCVESPETDRPWFGIYDPDTGITLGTRDPNAGTAALPFDLTYPYGVGVLLPDGRVALVSDDFVANARNAVDILSFGP